VLDHVGDVGEATVDAGGGQPLVEHPAGGTDEGLTLEVLAVAGLLADEDELGARLPLAEDRLGGVPPEVAGLAAGRRRPQRLEGAVGGDEGLGEARLTGPRAQGRSSFVGATPRRGATSWVRSSPGSLTAPGPG
jgi:hypothetical protein